MKMISNYTKNYYRAIREPPCLYSTDFSKSTAKVDIFNELQVMYYTSIWHKYINFAESFEKAVYLAKFLLIKGQTL